MIPQFGEQFEEKRLVRPMHTYSRPSKNQRVMGTFVFCIKELRTLKPIKNSRLEKHTF
jgi:hypothetical protein